MTTTGRLPDPRAKHPLTLPDGRRHMGTVFLNNALSQPNIVVGDYTYANDNDEPDDWARLLAPYTWPWAPERLVIGKFRQIAQGVRFITASANHPMGGASCYPFGVFDPERFAGYAAEIGVEGDVVVGNDCWIAAGATLLPKARLGDGVIVGARAVVAGDVPDYAVVAGNPAVVVKRRFKDGEIARLKRLAWWDWPHAAIEAAIPAIEAADLDALEAMAP